MLHRSLTRFDSAGAWAHKHATWPGEIGYVAGRMLKAPESIRRLLEPIHLSRRELAIDAGAGGGMLTFALAELFEEVIGIDVRRRSIWLGRHVARIADHGHVRFDRADATSYRTPRRADLVLSNLMSHGGSDREAMVRRFRTWVRDGGWLIYSEETEAYPLMEMVSAVRMRDVRSLRARADQLLNGLLRRPGFTYFNSGSANAVLEHVGWLIVRQEVSTWRGVPYTQTTWAKAGGQREHSIKRRLVDTGSNAEETARMGLVLANAALPSGKLRPRWASVLPAWLGSGARPDWSRLEELADEVERRLEERTGMVA